MKLSSQLPILQNTVLSWIVGGKINREHLTDASWGICTEDEELEACIARLCELDEVETINSRQQCNEHFVQNTSKNHQDPS